LSHTHEALSRCLCAAPAAVAAMMLIVESLICSSWWSIGQTSSAFAIGVISAQTCRQVKCNQCFADQLVFLKKWDAKTSKQMGSSINLFSKKICYTPSSHCSHYAKSCLVLAGKSQEWW
jgi:hypothetical protein